MDNGDNINVIGLDKITADDENSAAKNRAVDLTKLERPLRIIVPENRDNVIDIIREEDFSKRLEAKAELQTDSLQLEKITEADFLPEHKYLSINQDIIRGKKPSDTITKDSSEAAPPDPRDREFKDMAMVTKKDEVSFEEHNTTVDLSPVTDKLCKRCGRKLSDLEKRFFKNECASCSYNDSEKFRKSCSNRYFIVLGLLILISIFTAVEAAVEYRPLTIAAKVFTAMAVGVISVYFTFGLLAKKVSTNMPQTDYVIIGTVVLVGSVALQYFISPLYLIIALIYFAYTVQKDQKRIKAEKLNYESFSTAEKSTAAKNNSNTADNGNNLDEIPPQ